MDLTSDEKRDEDKAYKATEKKRNSSTDTKECTYCKKYYPNSKSIGHTWNECYKLKVDREKKSDKEKMDETAKITTNDSSETTFLLRSLQINKTKATPTPSDRLN
jgi:hypothetical protein